jgi:hypothetical protein
MTFTSIASNPTQHADSDLTVNIVKLSKISVAASLLVVMGATFLPNLLWVSASYPAELNTAHKQVAPAVSTTAH